MTAAKATKKPLARALPRELTTSDVVWVEADHVNVMAKAPTECPRCHVARTLFVFRRPMPKAQWMYACLPCDITASVA